MTMYRIERLVPLLGATVAGPLGVVHLPRMWLKGVLSAAGRLYEGYFDNYKGFNQWVTDGIGLEPEPWFAFLGTMPTYPQAEEYVKAHATKIDPASIAAINDTVLTFLRPDENAAPIRERAGIDDPDFRVSCRLIAFDDWTIVHQQLSEHRDGVEPIVPMVSSAQTGMLGVPHLPRLWFKRLLHTVRALPEGWKTGTECGFDRLLAETIGLDLVAACAYIDKEFPAYMQFERWVSDHIAKPDEATKAQWVEKFANLEKPEATAATDLAEAGAPAGITRNVILLNDMVDWKHMHDHLVAQRVART